VKTRVRSAAVLEVLWNRLRAIASEMGVTLVRTSFSTGIRLNRDYSCAIFDAEGNMIAQSSNAPGQLGSMPNVLKEIRRWLPYESLDPGDIFITNDPWIGCGHTPDIYIGSPVFYSGKLVGFAVNSAHHIDVGGRLTSHQSRDVHEEGLIIPVTKLFAKGVPNEDLFNLIRYNVRFPDKVIGDLRAQVVANKVGAARLSALLDDYQLHDLTELSREIIRRTERSVRASIEKIPDGVYSYKYLHDEMDEDGKPLEIRASIQVSNDDILVDFVGTSPEVKRPINSVLNYTRAYTFVGIKMAIGPEIPTNEGFFRPIALTVPEGTILNPRFPAPVRWRTSVGLLIPEIIFLALSGVIPERVMAGSGTVPRWHQLMYGVDDQGEKFMLNCHFMGGLGARFAKDGLSVVAWPANIMSLPVETIESETPLLVLKKEYHCDSGGPGRFRGGCGQTVIIWNRPRAGVDRDQEVSISLGAGRFHEPAAGLMGGEPGAKGQILKNTVPLKEYRQDLVLQPDDTITFGLPGGAGFGSPLERDVDRVAEDVKNGFVSLEKAAASYGVVFDPQTNQVNVTATAARRQHLSRKRLRTESSQDHQEK